MNFFSFLVVGVVVSWIASVVVQSIGVGDLSTLVVGVLGALLGGFIFEILGYHPYAYWDSIETSVIGAVILVTIVRLIMGAPKLRRQIV